MDISSFEHSLASLTAAKNIGQAVLGMNGKSDVHAKVIELQYQIVAPMNTTAEAKWECVRLIEENSNIKHELWQLREEIRTKEAINFGLNVFSKRSGGGREWPQTTITGIALNAEKVFAGVNRLFLYPGRVHANEEPPEPRSTSTRLLQEMKRQ